MPAEPYQDPAFANSVTYTVAITYTVAGGARYGTADRRARKVAERLASHATRLGGVLEVTAVAGPSQDGQVASPERVRFDQANTGHGTRLEPGKLDRYLDPDYERALASLQAANDAYRARQRADRERRTAVDCRNTHRPVLPDRCYCECVYCQPDLHLEVTQLPDASGPTDGGRLCLCGASVATADGRCHLHLDVRLVVLAGDDEPLQLLSRDQRGDAR